MRKRVPVPCAGTEERGLPTPGWPVRALLAIALLSVIPVAGALDAAGDRFEFGGFGTLGLTYNDDDRFEFIRDFNQASGVEGDVSAKIDSNLGVQLSYRFRPDLKGVVQVVARHDRNGSIPPELTWAYLKYKPSPTWELRAGRMGWDVYMLSDNRNVNYSSVWIRPPIEYFGVQPYSHIDGVDVVGTFPLAKGLLWFKLYGGFADESLPLDDGAQIDLDDSVVHGGNVNYQIGHWWLRLGYANTELKEGVSQLEPLLDSMRASNSTAAALANDITTRDKSLQHYAAGAVYERGPLQVQLMLDSVESESLLVPDFDAGYINVGYRLDAWTPYMGFAAIESGDNRRDTGYPAGSPPDRSVDALLSDARLDQQTWTLGLRYDIRANVALKLQVDRIQAEDASASLTRDPEDDWDGRGTIFSASLDFVF